MSAATPHERLRNAPLPFIAEKIRDARLTAAEDGGPLSHDRLCERIPGGFYRANLIKLEQGLTRPRLVTLERIAAATGRDIEFFLPPEVGNGAAPFRGGRGRRNGAGRRAA